ncbi:CAP domain-containing protein [Evansella sp. AB-rgal1]|uniref:CAP domain-containing protein n=1 Tax=Evansella sp. AB-rgal1 TaxID=3242696 RepID=UPI00359DFD6E
MKTICTLILGFFLFFSILYFINDIEKKEPSETETSSSVNQEPNVQNNDKEKQSSEKGREPEKEEISGIHSFVGMEIAEIQAEYGEPDRVDVSSYGYDWWIYHTPIYIQIGVSDGMVVSVYTNDPLADTAYISIGDSYETVGEYFSFTEEVTLTGSFNSYRFELKAEDVLMRPLAPISDIWIQFYFDTVTRELSSIRFIDQATLLLHRPYSIVYRGSLPEAPQLSDDEWEMVQEGQARQIFDLTNLIRKKHNLSALEWDDTTADVAYLHSEDMKVNDYFSHSSPTYGELKDRFQAGEISFQLAAENIAANYVDGIEAVEGWLNSEGHRVNLLDERFTHLGVGVYRNYYTQNFMVPW